MDSTDYENGYILIKEGIITAVGDMSNAPHCDDIFDANGGYVVPGFIDAHCHLGLFRDGEGYDNEDANEKASPVMPQLRVVDGIHTGDKTFREAYEAGVTTVAVSPGSRCVIGGQVAVISTYNGRIINKCAAIKAALGDNPKASGNPSTRPGVVALLRQALYNALLTEMPAQRRDGNLPSVIPVESNFIESALLKVLNREISLHIHVHRADDIMTAIRIADEFNIKINLIHATEAYKICRVGNLPLALNQNSEFPSVMLGPLICDRSKPELAGFNDENPSVLEQNGIKTAIISDHPELPSRYLLLSAQLAVKNGMTERNALRAITVNPAEILGINDNFGKISEGYNADILVFDNHPIDFKSKIIAIFTYSNAN